MTTQSPTDMAGMPSIDDKQSGQDADRDTSSARGVSHNEHLTPRTLSRSSTPVGGLKYYDDDDHDEYEWIRVPKKRDYDLFQAARIEPEDRNKAHVPLTVSRPNKSDATIWAKMDTGGGRNTINSSTVTAIFGEAAKSHMRAMTMLDISLLPGVENLQITHSVDLDFIAGRSRKSFERINFLVVPDVVEQSSRDGVPNVILGYKFLKDNDMLMIDLEYCYDAVPDQEVIAARGEDENSSAVTILPSAAHVKLANTPGVSRPIRA